MSKPDLGYLAARVSQSIKLPFAKITAGVE